MDYPEHIPHIAIANDYARCDSCVERTEPWLASFCRQYELTLPAFEALSAKEKSELLDLVTAKLPCPLYLPKHNI